MKQIWKLLLIVILAVAVLVGCTGDTEEQIETDPPEIEETTPPEETAEPELGPHGLRLIRLTEEARDIALEDFDFLAAKLLENISAEGIFERRFQITFEAYLDTLREVIYNMEPIESFTGLVLDQEDRWDGSQTDPQYIAADYLFSLLGFSFALDLGGFVHMGPQPRLVYEDQLRSMVMMMHDPDAAIAVMRDIYGADSYLMPPPLTPEMLEDLEEEYNRINAPAVRWFYDVDTADFDLTVLDPIADAGLRDPNNLTMEVVEEDRVAYLGVQSFMNNPRFDSETLLPFLEEIQDFEHLIIDLRGNGGGFVIYVQYYFIGMMIGEALEFEFYEFFAAGEDTMGDIKDGLRHILNASADEVLSSEAFLEARDFPNMNPVDREIFEYVVPWQLTLTPSGNSVPFAGDIWVLVDNRSASASEFTALLALNTGFATVVGTPTMGVTPTTTMQFFLPNTGIMFRTDIGHMIDYSGRSVEEFGVQPDILIAPGEDALEIVLGLIA